MVLRIAGRVSFLPFLLAAALVRACGEGPAAGPDDEGPPSTPNLLGADVSALERIEEGGASFRDAGQPGDALAILRARGATVFRLRVFVDPDREEVRVNDLDYTLRMATRIRATGAALLLDLHYSETWTDPAHQSVPAAWAGLDFDALVARVHAYTSEVVGALRTVGAAPAIVQIGNEIDSGLRQRSPRAGTSMRRPD